MKSLKVLGIVEIGTYLACFVALLYANQLLGRPAEQYTFDGLRNFLIQAYLVAGLTLAPSVYVFVRYSPKTKPETLENALNLQKILFIAVCAAVLPLLYISMSAVPEYYVLLVACLLGIGFHIWLKLITKATKP